MWTIERVITELNKLAEADGIASIKEPIRSNARLRSTLGRVKCFARVIRFFLLLRLIEKLNQKK